MGAPRVGSRRSGTFGGQALDVLPEDVLGEGADVLGADAALLVDEERLGGALDPVVDADLAGGVRGVGKAQPEVAHEFQSLVIGVLDVDAEYDDLAVAPRLPAAL